MPRYFFNIYDGVTILDDDGTELADWEQARVEAVRLCGQVLLDHPRRIAIGEDWRMEVTDERGLILFRLDFHVMESPATMGAARGPNPPQA